jgi:putative phosphonate catabolism associated alcohol dehydrogenase
MTAMVFTGPGDPLLALSQPQAPLLAGEVRVRILACTLCQSDVATYTGRRREAVPTVLGHEMVGVVTGFGPDTPALDAAGHACPVGDRITWAVVASCGQCDPCHRGLLQKCLNSYKYGHAATTLDAPDGGGLATVLTLRPGTAWYRVPDAVPTPTAALANCAGATVAAVVAAAGELHGRRVLVLGAGLLGIFACAMAAEARAAVITAIDPDTRLRSRAQAFGATHVEAPEESQSEHDVIFELAGRAASVQAGLMRLALGGTLVLAGTVSPTPGLTLDPERIVRRMQTICGVHNYHPRDLKIALDFLARTVVRHPYAELIAGTYTLPDAATAFTAAVAAPGRRILVHPPEPT